MRILPLIVWFVAGLVQAQTPVAMDSASAALQQQVEALIEQDNAHVHGARTAWPEWMHQFYAARSFRLAWTNTHAAQELRRAIADSRLDGLDPDDYHSSLLQQLQSELAATPNDMLRAQYDLLQTDALLRLGYHLSFGKVDPETFDAQWNYGRTLAHLDAAKEIEAALAADDIYARVEALKPTHRLYVTLKAELARYRAAAAAGGWQPIPKGMTLRPGAQDARVPALRARLTATGDLDPAALTGAQDTVYGDALVAAVRRFQERIGVGVDGAVGVRTVEELNVPVEQRILQLRVNLDRGRVLLQDLPPQFVVVNIAGYLIYVVRGDDIIWTSRVQVGKPFRRTPLFRSEINYLVWNPTWTVPPSIILNDILPVARRDPTIFARRGLDVLDRNGAPVDPASIDWSQYRSGHIPYTLRQEPGPDNALGRVKFMFPNAYSVYLHDTPSKSLFDASDRSFSSGCVRVERPLELAAILLNDPQQWNETTIARTIQSERLQNVTLKQKMPVLLAYWTAWVDTQGRTHFRRDIYGQDAQWAAGLDSAFRVRKRPLARVDVGVGTSLAR